MLESREVIGGGKKASSIENGLGRTENCTGCCYYTLFKIR